MNKQLDEQLCANHPKIFVNRHGDTQSTAMCWGFSCGDGWYNIIDTACYLMQTVIDRRLEDIRYCKEHNLIRDQVFAGDMTLFDEKNGKYKQSNPVFYQQMLDDYITKPPREIPEEIPQVVAVQVKEKFGGLRFYTRGGNRETDTFIEFAEAMSYRTCEECGAPGTVRGGGWVRTLCDEHAKACEDD